MCLREKSRFDCLGDLHLPESPRKSSRCNNFSTYRYQALAVGPFETAARISSTIGKTQLSTYVLHKDVNNAFCGITIPEQRYASSLTPSGENFFRSCNNPRWVRANQQICSL